MSLTKEELSEWKDKILSSDGNLYFGFETDMLQ